MGEELVAAGWAALAQERWDDAVAAFEAALADGAPPDAMAGLADVREWQEDYAAAVELRTRAYGAYLAQGNVRAAARLAAYHIAFGYAAVYGDGALAAGWLARGRRLVEDAGDCAERGWVELSCVPATDDLDEKERHIAAARELGRRCGDADLELDALAYAGATAVQRGRVPEGMACLDEAAAAAQGGEVSDRTVVGEIYCKVLLACELTLDVRRAEQWAGVASAFARPRGVRWASAICRMYYGGILTAAGRWDEADAELSRSLVEYDATYRALRSGALVRLAELRVRQGRLEEAEALLDGAAQDAHAAVPLARLHLARGEAERAAVVLHRAGAVAAGIAAAPALALLADAEIAAGRSEPARAAADRLATLAELSRTPALGALSEHATALLATDRPEAARRHLEAALGLFTEASLPFEAARSRLVLAGVLAPGAPDAAVAEARAALAEFERVGAWHEADAAAALLRSLGVRGRTGARGRGALSRREQEVLELLVRGLTNPEIAARLVISRKTAAHHVSSVLTKLGARNRAEAAALGQALRRTRVQVKSTP